MAGAATAIPTLSIGPLDLDIPVILAPMAGITNTAFRRLCREYGAGLYVSEMITSRALVERTPGSMRLIKHHESEVPRSIQLYGVDPNTVSEAIRFLVDEDLCDHIDLNFGCPVPKVTRKGGGAALPWKRDLFRQILESAVKASGDLPLTIKMRKGIDQDHLTFIEAGKAAEGGWCCLHCFTRQDRLRVLFGPGRLGRHRGAQIQHQLRSGTGKRRYLERRRCASNDGPERL